VFLTAASLSFAAISPFPHHLLQDL